MNKMRITIMTSALFAFAIISYLIMANDTLLFDTAIREYVYSLRNEGTTRIMTAITYIGNPETITGICILSLFLLFFKKSYGLSLSATAVLSTAIQKALKAAFHRQRPEIELHLIQQGGYSFPSGHSMTVLVFYGMIIFLCRRYIKNRSMANIITVFLSILIFLIGFSRIYLGVHYPTDVLGGWAIGVCLLTILTFGVSVLYKK